MSDEPVHVVAGVIRDATGRVLVAQRPAGKHLAGFWEFPGGKSDPGETPLDALIVTAHAGDAHAREHEALRWVDPAELTNLPMPPADGPIVTALQLPDR